MSVGIIPIICIATGVSIYIIIMIQDRYPPKKINNIYGYRTKRSMKSQEHWDYAQNYSSAQMKKASIGMISLGILGSFLDLGQNLELALGLFIIIGLMIAGVFATEQELKRRFPDD